MLRVGSRMANRVLTVLKAALNHAWREGVVPSDDAWRRVSPFKGVDAPVIRYLAEDEQRRLVNAYSADFREIVRAALLTGCRYGELIALRAADYHADAGTITVCESKAGKVRHVVLTDEGCTLFDALTAARKGDTRIFLRSDGKPWGASHQQRPLAEACARARISPAVSFHILRHSHGSTLAMRGVPMGVIAAQLGHSDTRMTEKHYAHLAPSYVADTIRANFPNLGITKDGAVQALRSKSV
jgi:integrase